MAKPKKEKHVWKVRPDPHEYLVYWVESETSPGHEYRLDMHAGLCACANFNIRLATEAGKVECKHFAPCYELVGRQVLEKVRKDNPAPIQKV